MTISAIQPAFSGLAQRLGKPQEPVFAGKRLLSQPVAPSWDLNTANTTLSTFPQHAPPSFNAAFHKDRRNALLATLPPNSTVVVTGAREFTRNDDVNFKFRQDSSFYYLTGFDEPDSVAVLSNVPGQPRYTLVVRDRDPLMETWNGKRAGTAGARATYGADEAYTNDQLDAVLAKVAKASGRLMTVPSEVNTELNAQVTKVLRANNNGPRVRDITPQVHRMRLIKTPYEIALLKQAVAISAQGHLDSMKKLRATGQESLNEGRVQALTEYNFRDRGAVRVGYESIAGAGGNACVLHYITNVEDAKDGDLLLQDAGAEYGYYTADITRTWPVNGKFTPEQKAIYDIVLEAQESGIQMVKPGVTMGDIHRNSVRKITEGLVNLGLLKGDVDKLINTRAYAKYFMHGTSHMLGLDVHDVSKSTGAVGTTGRGLQNEPAQAGMVFTVEPGIYIPADDTSVDAKWRGIGVRIEDDILVTPTGHENLSAAIPRTTAAIEALMAGGPPPDQRLPYYRKPRADE